MTATPFERRGLVAWAPTWGGMFVALGVIILLSSLGLAIGVGSGATTAGIWGAISVIIGFLVGGWFTGQTLSVRDSLAAAAHGLLMWAVALLFTLLFVVMSAFLSINALSAVAQIPFVANILGALAYTPASPNAAATAITSSWAAFLVLLLSVAAAAVGAIIGNQGRMSGVYRRS